MNFWSSDQLKNAAETFFSLHMYALMFSFVATKMILVATPATDINQLFPFISFSPLNLFPCTPIKPHETGNSMEGEPKHIN